ncbi:hypothetical protein Poli38472_006886 [Pythium oligandrum]|uniref:Ricin B lectin domain-containing protein n=1 Tax=Pythium oligandrum TaxID=41045 RepID=A0A8K1C5L9_PYTOL|nr:hypothetical protein Poli38472_006886 [Pythium oligandrum]|eukprot:TMW56876.1 hypothetical protein Poli38472_006886 [Pythium oligandrum]
MKLGRAADYGSDNPEEAAFLRSSPSLPRPKPKKSKKYVLVAVGASLCLASANVGYHMATGSLSGASSMTPVAVMEDEDAPLPINLVSDQVSPGYGAVPSVLQGGREFVLRIRGKNNLCVDGGGGRNKAETKFLAQPCNPSNVNQMFVYDAVTHQIRSARKPNLCVDDGGANTPSGSNTVLYDCDVDNLNQRFIYDEGTQMFRNPAKSNLCLDDGDGTTAGQSRFVLYTCDNNNPNQHFEVKFRDDWEAERQKVIDAVYSGAKFMMRVSGKDNLCG